MLLVLLVLLVLLLLVLLMLLVLLVLLLVMGNLVDKLVIVMGKLGKLVLKGLILVKSLEICDILGGELLLVEGRVGHAAVLASCQQASRQAGRQAGATVVGNGEGGDGKRKGVGWVWDGGGSEEMTGGTLTLAKFG